MFIHIFFDALAALCAGLCGQWVKRHYLREAPTIIRYREHPSYFTALGLGVLVGAILLGSVNLNFGRSAISSHWRFGHSSAGAIAGGILGVEIYKKWKGIRFSTGLVFVAPLASGLAVGRWGCFFAGLDDFTYGTETALPWGRDFGDGISRHPVQLYESFSMLGFLVGFLWSVKKQSSIVRRHGFYLFIFFYGIQRFLWEFLKPYPTVFGPMNLFHVICIMLIIYAFVMSKGLEAIHA